MSPLLVLILVIVGVNARPSHYAERNNYGFEVASLNEPIARSAATESEKHPKNSAGEIFQSFSSCQV